MVSKTTSIATENTLPYSAVKNAKAIKHAKYITNALARFITGLGVGLIFHSDAINAVVIPPDKIPSQWLALCQESIIADGSIDIASAHVVLIAVSTIPDNRIIRLSIFIFSLIY